jgi:hypothetical protein
MSLYDEEHRDGLHRRFFSDTIIVRGLGLVEKTTKENIYSGDGDNTYFRNADKYIPDYTLSKPKTPQSQFVWS